MEQQVLLLQQQVIAAKRQQILAAATTVFAAKGYHKATVRDIAQEAGIADGTIYNYFKNKEALLIGILDQLNETDDRAEAFTAEMTGDLRQFFVAYLHHRLDVMLPNTQVFKALLPEILVNDRLRQIYTDTMIVPTMSLVEEQFAALMAAGVIRPLDPALTVRTLAGAVFGLLMLHLLGDPLIFEKRDELPEHLAAVLFDGLLLDKATHD